MAVMIAALCYAILSFPVAMTGGSIRWSKLLILHDNPAILILDIINKMKQNENYENKMKLQKVYILFITALIIINKN